MRVRVPEETKQQQQEATQSPAPTVESSTRSNQRKEPPVSREAVDAAEGKRDAGDRGRDGTGGKAKGRRHIAADSLPLVFSDAARPQPKKGSESGKAASARTSASTSTNNNASKVEEQQSKKRKLAVNSTMVDDGRASSLPRPSSSQTPLRVKRANEATAPSSVTRRAVSNATGNGAGNGAGNAAAATPGSVTPVAPSTPSSAPAPLAPPIAKKSEKLRAKASSGEATHGGGTPLPTSPLNPTTAPKSKRLLGGVAAGTMNAKKRKRGGLPYSIPEAISNNARELKERIGDRGKSAHPIASVFLAIGRFLANSVYILFRSLWRLLVFVAVMLLVVAFVGGAGVLALAASTLDEFADISDYTKISMPQDSTIYDRDGQVIGVVSTSNRTQVAFNEISQPAKDATVSIEDERFYNHEGVDLVGVARALKENYESWRTGDNSTQGASTITQQYVRNAYQNVGFQQTVSRKMTEMMLAVQLETSMSKDDILLGYMNTIYYGHGNYGIEAASRYYFGHSASTLDYYESAVLAAVLNGPSIYDPVTEEGAERTAERVNLILDKMYSLGKLGETTQEELHALKQVKLSEKLNITEKTREINQPFYYDFVMQELNGKYEKEEIEAGGWQIYTTLSIADGQAAEQQVAAMEEQIQNGVTAALVDMDVKTGAVNAFCGGTDYTASQFNTATQSHLQTGSSLKPLVYAALCEYNGYQMTDKIDNSPIDIGTADAPHVITPYFSGGSLEQSLVYSDNSAAIHAAQIVGMDKVDELCKASGMTSDLDNNVVAAIGGMTGGYSPLEMATAYNTIANKGTARTPWSVKTITDNLGNKVYEHEDDSSYAMSPEVAKQVTHSLEACVKDAGWYDISFAKSGGWTIGAKTGTTNEGEDVWLVGYDTKRTVSVWIGGRDQRVALNNDHDKSVYMFDQYMWAVAQGDKKESFEQPEWGVTIPNSKAGESLDSYMSRASSMGFTTNVSYVDPTASQPDGSLSVAGAGKVVKRGSSVAVSVARDKVEVPDFTTVTPGQAVALGEGLSLSFLVETSNSGSAEPVIAGQSVEAGTFVEKGYPVSITLRVTVPQASSTLSQVPFRGSTSAMFLLGNERDSLLNDNSSLKSQIASLNARLEALSNASASSGSGSGGGGGGSSAETQKTTVPDVVGLTADQAAKVLSSLGLKASYQGDGVGKIVKSQSPSGGTKVDVTSGSGGAVTLVLTASPEGEGGGND